MGLQEYLSQRTLWELNELWRMLCIVPTESARQGCSIIIIIFSLDQGNFFRWSHGPDWEWTIQICQVRWGSEFCLLWPRQGTRKEISFYWSHHPTILVLLLPLFYRWGNWVSIEVKWLAQGLWLRESQDRGAQVCAPTPLSSQCSPWGLWVTKQVVYCFVTFCLIKYWLHSF